MNKSVLEKIVGYEKVLELYGEWPTFHDAEVLRICLERESDSDFQGPTVKIDVHAFTMTSDLTPKGTYKCIHHATVSFKLDGAQDIKIEWFNHQNAIFGLEIEEIGDKTWEHDLFKLSLDSSYGVGAEVSCRRIEVVSVSPGIPRNSVY